ncbi:MAG: hypothetical protein JNK82_45560, partial [Myxococcaceae bacterium]|nr:hypothetical protein [Myxococcaceae bacterium]
VFTFRRGGEPWWALLGIVTGFFVGFAPLELLQLAFLLPFVALHAVLTALRHRSARVAHIVFAIAVAPGIAVGIAQPKGADAAPKELPASRLRLTELVRELNLGGETAHSETMVTLPSRKPTWREIETAIEEQTPLRLRLKTCGVSVSIATGAYVYGGSLEPAD